MASLHTIWKSRSLSWAAALLGAMPVAAQADCNQLARGIYVADADSDAQLDGGQWSRVQDQLQRSQLANKFRATTFQFGTAIVVAEGKPHLYRLLSNAADPRYEALSTRVALDVTRACSGEFKLEFQVDGFYPNEIALGSPSAKQESRLKYPLRVHQEGHVLPEGNLRITSCKASELRKSGWRETRDDLGLCNGARKGYVLFNIQPAVRGLPEWRNVDRP